MGYKVPIQDTAGTGSGACTRVDTAELQRARCSNRAGGNLAASHTHAAEGAAELGPAKVVQYIKRRSSRLLQMEFPELGKRYLGAACVGSRLFCATVGAVDEETIKHYIETQKWDEDDQGFKITAPAKP